MTRNVEMISSWLSIGNDVHELIPGVGILPLMAYTRRFRPKGVLFQALGI